MPFYHDGLRLDDEVPYYHGGLLLSDKVPSCRNRLHLGDGVLSYCGGYGLGDEVPSHHGGLHFDDEVLEQILKPPTIGDLWDNRGDRSARIKTILGMDDHSQFRKING